MSTFDADWLLLREPADVRARSARVTEAIGSAINPLDPVNVLDLGAGTGANLRYLVEHLSPVQHWLLVDHDASLLDRLPDVLSEWARARGWAVSSKEDDLLIARTDRYCRITRQCLNLARLSDASDLFQGRHLVTGSALLDLVSLSWLRAVAAACRGSGAAVLFALIYDGRVVCSPEAAADAEIRELVNRHQRTDKGFGMALGPEAADAALDCFASLGYEVERDAADWVLDGASPELQRQLIEGWAEAAAAIAPGLAALVSLWRAERLRHVDAGDSRLVVGHVDIAAWPPGFARVR